MSAELVAVATLATWLYLFVGRGFFWRGAERDGNLVLDGDRTLAPKAWPSVVAVVPARNEADVVAQSLGSLFSQIYRGRFSIILVDDESTDRTAAIARDAAKSAGAADRLIVLAGSSPPSGWTGKLWAMEQGLRRTDADFILFTDADIAYLAPDAVERLVRGALWRSLVLASLMVKLRCESPAERLLVPAFVFFFAMLYPFAWVNDLRKKTAAAAGGCMLVRREALQAAGGLQAIKGALIDDCALAALLKQRGPIWLGLTERVASLRPYPKIADIRSMVSRSAYAELRYSPLRLAGTLVGMALTYVAPPLLAIFGGGLAQGLGLVAWGAMTLSFQPMLRFYGRSPLWGAALPVIAGFYTFFTLDSAIQHWRGRGGAWKGRFQAEAAGRAPS